MPRFKQKLREHTRSPANLQNRQVLVRIKRCGYLPGNIHVFEEMLPQ
ncbi:hypothetical protein Barb7_02517 [Bacteroidales bacterium Barb7]|nr:hypothetical protein Barb7_02517 [Bacteroidales bacterium Barb7]